MRTALDHERVPSLVVSCKSRESANQNPRRHTIHVPARKCAMSSMDRVLRLRVVVQLLNWSLFWSARGSSDTRETGSPAPSECNEPDTLVPPLTRAHVHSKQHEKSRPETRQSSPQIAEASFA